MQLQEVKCMIVQKIGFYEMPVSVSYHKRVFVVSFAQMK